MSTAQLVAPEKWYPLRCFTCESCWLVQTEDYAHYSELFSSDYAYFSSYSSTWLKHGEAFTNDVIKRFGLQSTSNVIEVASNDGYLLQYFKRNRIQCLGIEPTLSTATAAREKGIDVLREFFGEQLAKRLQSEGMSADLVIANNVLAHVPDINDFVSGFAHVLKPDGVATFEFPHLMRLVDECQFDTIYHEHFSYFSLTVVNEIFEAHGLSIFDVEEIDTHGGSLRVFAQRKHPGAHDVTDRVSALLSREAGANVTSRSYYVNFQARADRTKDNLVSFLIQAKGDGLVVGAYGAAAKGNTLLNYAGVRSDLLAWVVDLNPAKQSKYLPGSRIPIVPESQLRQCRPHFVLILPWNLRQEIMEQLAYIREWGGRFVVAIPKLTIL